MSWAEWWAEMTDIEVLWELGQYTPALYLLVMLLIFYLGKLVFQWTVSYKLDEQLTTVDNKAVALTFAGYMLGLGIILYGVLSSPTSHELARDVVDLAIWGTLGIGFLVIAGWLNDKLLLPHFSTVKELVEDRNLGTGAVLAGGYVGVGLLVREAISGESTRFWIDVSVSVIYFFCAQAAFLLFGGLYRRVVRYNLHAELEKDNVSAGVGFGLNLVAVALLLSGYVRKYDSLVGLAVWFVLGALFLVVFRYLVDRLVLPGKLLDEEIRDDHNWGAALVEGAMAISWALLIVASF